MTYQELNQYILHYLTEDKTKSAGRKFVRGYR